MIRDQQTELPLGTAQGPVFIGGLAHSGKTPLRRLLSLHPRLALSRRTYMWTRFYNRYGDLRRQANFERCFSAMLAFKHMQTLRPDPNRIRREFWRGPPTYARLFSLFHEHYAERLGRPRWGDQLGFVEKYADPIFAAHPDAKIIHMIRDPRERYGVSALRSGRRLGGVGWATAKWLHSLALMQKNQARYPNGYQVVRYEALQSRPEETLREVCTFLGEQIAPEMLIAVKSGGCNAEEDELPTTARSPDAERVSQCELAFTQAYAGQTMQAVGYSLVPLRASTSVRGMQYRLRWLANWTSMVTWRCWNGCR